MPPRATRRGRGVSRYPTRSSVHNITNLCQWNRLHRRGKNQLVFVMYTLEFVRNSHRLKTTLVELSAHSDFQDVIFAIVDIDKAKEVADQEGIHDAPTFVCYQAGTVIDKQERVNGDAAPSSLWQMLHRNAVRVRAETARSLPDANQRTHWRAVRQVVAFLAFTVGAVLAVVLMQPVSSHEDEIKNIKRPPSRTSSVVSDSSDED